ncbi:MAG: hypothetical protein OCC49_13490 [Fibrobacterales bacterium]
MTKQDSTQLRNADSSAQGLSPDESSVSAVEECPLKKKKRPFTMQLRGREGPYADTPYELIVDGQRVSEQGAQTSNDGSITHDIAKTATKGVLNVWFEGSEVPEVYPLELLEPVSQESDEGFVGSVRALGIHPNVNGELTDVHIKALQRVLGITETGVVDTLLRAKVAVKEGA